MDKIEADLAEGMHPNHGTNAELKKSIHPNHGKKNRWYLSHGKIGVR